MAGRRSALLRFRSACSRSTLRPAPLLASLLLVGCARDPLPSVVINEIVPSNKTSLVEDSKGRSLRDADGTLPDWVELYNPTKDEVEITGWTLTDDLAKVDKWEFPDKTVIPADGYLVVTLSGTGRLGDLDADFRLQITGDEVGLYGPSWRDHPEVDVVEFGPVATDYSWALLEGKTEMVITWPTTPGEKNRLEPQPDGGAP